MLFTADEENAVLAAAGFVNDRDFVTALDGLRAQYNKPVAPAGVFRYYHTWQHALNVLSWSNTASMRLFEPAVRQALGWAALVHDAVYDELGSPENERRSADLLPGEALLARHLVMLTSQHGMLDSNDVTPAQAYFLDCDMAAFLCDPRWEVVLCNDRNIRKELRQVYSEREVAEGRAKFLKQLYDGRYIFLSKYFQQEHEQLARHNLWHLVFGDLYKKAK